MDEDERQGRLAIAALVVALNSGGVAGAERLFRESATFVAHRVPPFAADTFPVSALEAAMRRAFKPIEVLPGDRLHYVAETVSFIGDCRFLVLGTRSVTHAGGTDGRDVGWIIRTDGEQIAQIHSYPMPGLAIEDAGRAPGQGSAGDRPG